MMPGMLDRTAPRSQGSGEVRRLTNELLALLQARTGFALVMVTRVLGDDWRVVEVSRNSYGVEAGDTLRWSDSVCSRMVASGEPGPWLVGDVDAAPLAADAPVRRHHQIRAYAGVPLRSPDGSFLGTLCAIDPESRAVTDEDLFAFSESFASWALASSLDRAIEQRAAERRLLRDRQPGAVELPPDSWRALAEIEADRTRWTGEALVLALARQPDGTQPRGRRAEVLAGLRVALGEAASVSVLGSNRIGILSVGRTVAGLEAALAADALGVDLVCRGAQLSGADHVGDVLHELDAQLVGEGAAAARASSRLLVYSFCDACGRKGLYQRPGTDLWRCKYCRMVLDAPPTA
jgi:GAF domain-containing protein